MEDVASTMTALLYYDRGGDDPSGPCDALVWSITGPWSACGPHGLSTAVTGLVHLACPAVWGELAALTTDFEKRRAIGRHLAGS
jgi:hypothetical protein